MVDEDGEVEPQTIIDDSKRPINHIDVLPMVQIKRIKSDTTIELSAYGYTSEEALTSLKELVKILNNLDSYDKQQSNGYMG